MRMKGCGELGEWMARMSGWLGFVTIRQSGKRHVLDSKYGWLYLI
jgi:hypothetical protein